MKSICTKLVKTICLLLVFLMMVSCGTKEDNKLSIPDMYKASAQKFIDEGDYQSAIDVLEEGIAATQDEGLTTFLKEVKATQEEASKQDPEDTSPVVSPSQSEIPESNQPIVQDADMALAMLNALDYDISTSGCTDALLMDLDDNGTKDLITCNNNKTSGQIYYWAESQIQSKELGAPDGPYGRLEWWLCQDAATGEYGIDWCSIGGGAFEGGFDLFYYLSHNIFVTKMIAYGGNIFTIDGQNVTEAEVNAAYEQNKKVMEIFVGDGSDAAIAKVRNELNAMLPVEQQISSIPTPSVSPTKARQFDDLVGTWQEENGDFYLQIGYADNTMQQAYANLSKVVDSQPMYLEFELFSSKADEGYGEGGAYGLVPGETAGTGLKVSMGRYKYWLEMELFDLETGESEYLKCYPADPSGENVPEYPYYDPFAQ